VVGLGVFTFRSPVRESKGLAWLGRNLSLRRNTGMCIFEAPTRAAGIALNGIGGTPASYKHFFGFERPVK